MTDFLYPFLDAREDDVGAVLDDLEASAMAKAEESSRLTEATLADLAGAIDAVAASIAERTSTGGTLLTFGNGGSATDAATTAALFAVPATGRPVRARSLVADPAVLTALANDVGYERVFARQLIAAARPDDVALGISTSGDSANLLAAFDEARRRGLCTVALVGGGGGAAADSPSVDHLLCVRSASVHRIQEAQAAVAAAVWEATQRRFDGGVAR